MARALSYKTNISGIFGWAWARMEAERVRRDHPFRRKNTTLDPSPQRIWWIDLSLLGPFLFGASFCFSACIYQGNHFHASTLSTTPSPSQLLLPPDLYTQQWWFVVAC